MKKPFLAVLSLVFLLVAGLFWTSSRSGKEPPANRSALAQGNQPPAQTQPVIKDERSDAEKRARSAELNAKASRALRFDQSEARLLNNPLDRTQLSEEALFLDNPSLSSEVAMETLYSLLSSLRTTANKGDYPAGLNVEITNALLGDNPRKVGVIPMDTPRINENGELVDEYGTPFFFHSPTSAELTITSAGPDRLMHTEDDIRYPSK